MTINDLTSVSAVRALSIDMIEQAKSGHPGAPMGLAPLAWTLYSKHLKHNPSNPSWLDRDRFVLSCGHASALLYATLHLSGYELSIEDLKQFRQLHSKTPGHPETHTTPGVEATTGPLGQGIANGVGMALTEAMLAARYNHDSHNIIDHNTYVICSDGDLQEGMSHEAFAIAANLGLGKLVVFWDDNNITLDGPLSWSLKYENVMDRIRSYGWRTLTIQDGNDLEEIDRVITEARQSDGRPTFVQVKTVIGYGAPSKAGTAGAHGAPLGKEEADGAKAAYGWTYAPFEIPAELYDLTRQNERGKAAEAEWMKIFDEWQEQFADQAEQLQRVLHEELPDDYEDYLPEWTECNEATRVTSHIVLNKIAAFMPELIGGSADLSGSNRTRIENSGIVEENHFGGRNINFGVREHAMAAIANGMLYHGGLRPFIGTFAVFSDYMRGAIRVAALAGLPAIYVLTHDSFYVGEDGPTHQPAESITALRAIPNLDVIRPADARETLGAWLHAIKRTDGPTAILLTRQNLPLLEDSQTDIISRGGYEIWASDTPDVILMASGSEVSLAIKAAEKLEDEDDIEVRVISVPIREMFMEQDNLDELLGEGDAPVIAIEAGISMGWYALADECISLDDFGASGPAEDLAEEFGFTPDQIADAVRDILED